MRRCRRGGGPALRPLARAGPEVLQLAWAGQQGQQSRQRGAGKVNQFASALDRRRGGGGDRRGRSGGRREKNGSSDSQSLPFRDVTFLLLNDLLHSARGCSSGSRQRVEGATFSAWLHRSVLEPVRLALLPAVLSVRRPRRPGSDEGARACSPSCPLHVPGPSPFCHFLSDAPLPSCPFPQSLSRPAGLLWDSRPFLKVG